MRRQHGLSLVELMVGLALGLLVVSIATTLLVSRIREHRAMLVEARLMQDLRTSTELIARDLRRAGYWGNANAAMHAAEPTAPVNPYTTVSPLDESSTAVAFRFSRDERENDLVDTQEQFGFRLRGGVIQMLIGDGSWQALTDAGTMVVTTFQVTPAVRSVPLDGACQTPCPPGVPTCRPVQQVRSMSVLITARATTDKSVVRSLRSQVRLRNDTISGSCTP